MDWQDALASDVFWLMATADVSLAARMFTTRWERRAGGLSELHASLRASQRQDDWLLVGVIAMALWFASSEHATLARLCLLPLLVWLFQRVMQRWRLFRRPNRWPQS